MTLTGLLFTTTRDKRPAPADISCQHLPISNRPLHVIHVFPLFAHCLPHGNRENKGPLVCASHTLSLDDVVDFGTGRSLQSSFLNVDRECLTFSLCFPELCSCMATDKEWIVQWKIMTKLLILYVQSFPPALLMVLSYLPIIYNLNKQRILELDQKTPHVPSIWYCSSLCVSLLPWWENTPESVFSIKG